MNRSYKASLQFSVTYLLTFSILYFSSFIGQILTVLFSFPGFILGNILNGNGFWYATHNLPPENPILGVIINMIIYGFIGYLFSKRKKS